MTRQDKLRLQRRRRRKFFWLFMAAAVAALVFTEQVAVLFVLATLAICGLLTVVALSNLEERDAQMQAVAVAETNDAMNVSRASRQESKIAA